MSGLDAHEDRRASLFARDRRVRRRRPAVRVWVLGQYPLSNLTLKTLLEEDRRLKLLGVGIPQAEDGLALVVQQPDVIIVTEALESSGRGAHLIATLHERWPHARMLSIGTRPANDEEWRGLGRLGMAGWLPESIDLASLEEAILFVSSGGGVADDRRQPPPGPGNQPVRRLMDRAPSLTLRESEILQCVGAGMVDRAIGARLHLAESTVRVHLRSIYRKLGVRNRAQAAAYAASHGLIPVAVHPHSAD